MSSARANLYLSGLVRYIGAGVTATVTDLVTFVVFREVLGWHYIVSGALSFIIATFAAYAYGLAFVFKGRIHSRAMELTMVFAASGVGLALHVGVLYVLVAGWDLHPIAAKVLSAGATFVWNYTVRYLWIFARD